MRWRASSWVLVLSLGGAIAAGHGCAEGGKTGDDPESSDVGGGSNGDGGATGSSSGAGGLGGDGMSCEPTVEACNGADDDCDGDVDEDCSCSPGETQACYSGPGGTDGEGECQAGVQTCDASGTWGPCEGEVTPADEECNGLDDDCDGEVDDLGTVTCGEGACEVEVPACEGGLPAECTPAEPGVEVCNGVDDDCDGETDESFPDQGTLCDTGLPGGCGEGVLACTKGELTCVPDVAPGMETCNGVDDDCDGQIDEDVIGAGGACTTGLSGACSEGVLACSKGAIDCVPKVEPSPETCNGKDDDCDGEVDEGDPGGGAACNTGLPGACAAGVQTCKNGKLECGPKEQPGGELCNGKDDDCDGQVDEGNPGAGDTCSTGKPGVCSTGKTTCAAGKLTCVQDAQPTVETCNGKDDNCDGQTDEGNPGGGKACNTGKFGLCATGTETCSNGAITCVQNLQPAAETCGNGQDDDCDGQTDESCCAHDKCVTGAPLQPGCDGCVTTICALDSYCCSTQWDSLCVEEVRTYCGSLKCDEAKGTCAHTLCTTGAKLTSGCDSTKAGCVAKICAQDSFCCATSWDGICVNEVASICKNNCN